MASAIDQVFESLFYGSGSWLGLILFIILLAALIMAWKNLGLITVPISIMLGLTYLNHDLGWHSLTMFLYSIFAIIYLSKDKLRG
jgi:hypothetical protein